MELCFSTLDENMSLGNVEVPLLHQREMKTLKLYHDLKFTYACCCTYCLIGRWDGLN